MVASYKWSASNERCYIQRKLDRYSCIVDKLLPADYDNLFGYMTKFVASNGKPMRFENFETLYYALDRVRQIQGYGLFYNVKSDIGDTEYTDEECAYLTDYITSGCFEVPKRGIRKMDTPLIFKH